MRRPDLIYSTKSADHFAILRRSLRRLAAALFRLLTPSRFLSLRRDLYPADCPLNLGDGACVDLKLIGLVVSGWTMSLVLRASSLFLALV